MKSILKKLLTAFILVLMMTDFCKAQTKPSHLCPVSILSSSDEKLSMFEDLDAYKIFKKDIDNFKNNTAAGVLVFKFNPETNTGKLFIAAKTNKGFSCTQRGNNYPSGEIKLNAADITSIEQHLKALTTESYYGNCSKYSEEPDFNMAIFKSDKEIKTVYISDYEGFFNVDSNYNSNFKHVIQTLEIVQKYLYR